MAKKVGNQVLTKSEYNKQIKKFCKHIRTKIKGK